MARATGNIGSATKFEAVDGDIAGGVGGGCHNADDAPQDDSHSAAILVAQSAAIHHSDQIVGFKVTVTFANEPGVIEEWVKIVLNSLQTVEMKIVGLDTEFTDQVHGVKQKDLPPKMERRAAVLQLCFADDCLVYHIVHSPRIPEELNKFLAREDIFFCGAAIGNDVKVLEPYGLHVKNAIDLQTRIHIPKTICSKPTPSLFDLANFVLGTNLEKGNECKQLRNSGWEIAPLNIERIRYAAFDALISFEIAKGATILGYMRLDE
ncbi:Werner Syndrome-like exonuclease [Triticum dicoccoides]|uniref:Werner Syndrome-like exonuclease n=1 Tax=Triticum dicoccoides TaxID=85692 RepID=UPI001891CDEC|nr:Werner Syndrome-like exonuclease [Triticum dicoccoides]